MISFLKTGQRLLSSFLAANLTINHSYVPPSSSSPRWVESENLLFVTPEGKQWGLGAVLFEPWPQSLWQAHGSPSWRYPPQVSPTCALITDVLPPEGTEAPSCSAVKLKSEQGVWEPGWRLDFKSQDECQENFWIIKLYLTVVKLALRTFLFFFYAVWKFSEREKEPEDSNQYLMLYYYYYYFEKSLPVWAHSRKWRRTGKPGGLQSMGSQRVGLDFATEHTSCTFYIFIHSFTWNRHKLPTFVTFIHSLEKEKLRILPVTGTKLGFGETDNERSYFWFSRSS